MAHGTRGSGVATVVAADRVDQVDDWGPDPLPEVDLADDLRASVGRAAAGEERLVVLSGGEQVAAIIPIEDLRLLLRLEEEELDGIDVEELRKLRDNPEDQELIPWEAIKAKHGL